MTNRRIAIWLSAVTLLVYCGTAKGVLEEVDDAAMLRVTQSIVHDFSTAVPPDTPGAMPGIDGQWYTRYGIGQSLLAIPFYLVGSVLPSSIPTANVYDPHGYVVADSIAIVVTGLNMLVTSIAVGMTFLTCRDLGFRTSASVAAALALGVGTFAWQSARTFMSKPTSMLSVLLAFSFLLRFSLIGSRNRYLIASGACAGLMLLMRIANAVLLPVLGLWLLWILWRDRRTRWFAALAAWVVPIALTLAFLAYYNERRFGSIFETGYGDQAQAFTTPLYVGLYGLLLSSGKGVFFYAPVVLAGVLGWNALRKHSPSIALALAGLISVYLLFYARYDWWYGGGPWGPRFLVVILPLMCIGIAALLDGPLLPLQKLGVAMLAGLSLGVQLLSIVVPYLPYDASMEQDPTQFERLLWVPAYSPIIDAWHSLLHRTYPPDLLFTYYPFPWLFWAQ